MNFGVHQRDLEECRQTNVLCHMPRQRTCGCMHSQSLYSAVKPTQNSINCFKKKKKKSFFTEFFLSQD